MKSILSRALFGLIALAPAAAMAQPAPVRIAVMDDLSGVYKDIQGPGDVVAAKMAVDDYGGKVIGRPIELLSGDLMNKVDIGAALARRWYDEENVSVIFGLGNSAVALAVQDIARAKKRIDIVTSAGTTDLTGKNCSPYGVHWTYDTYALAKGTASAVSAAGGKNWYFITADYAFGHSLEENASHFVTATGGTVLGNSLTPLGTADYSSYLLQAQGLKASVIGIAAAGADMINVIKQMSEFGLMSSGVRAAGLLTLIPDVRAIGLKTAQGLYFTEAFYWDQNDETRAFSAPFRQDLRPPADELPGQHVWRRPALPEGDGRGRRGRCRQDHGQDARDADQRFHVQERQVADRWPRGARHVSVAGQGAGGQQERVGPGDRGRDDPGG